MCLNLNMESKDGPQDGPEDGLNPIPGVTVILPEVAPRIESSTQATGTPPFTPAQRSSTATGPPPVGMAQESSTPAPGPPPSAGSGRRRRGRPRKYGPDVAVLGTSGPILSPTPISAQPLADSGDFPDVQRGLSHLVAALSHGTQLPNGGTQPPSDGTRGNASEANQRHGNMTEGLGDKPNLITGGTFVPHVLIVNPGEDVSEKIQSLYNEGPRSICVICGSGFISNATLRQTECSGGRMTFEGHFQIVSFSGSFISTKLTGLVRRLSGGLSISLASADGRLIGGMLAGILIAASPVQVVLGSFLPSGYKEPKQRKQKSAYKPPPPSATMGPIPPPFTANVEHPIFEGNEQSQPGGAAAGSSSDQKGNGEPKQGKQKSAFKTPPPAAATATAGPMPPYTPNVDHPIFEGHEQSHHGGAAAVGTINDGIGSSSVLDLNFEDWGDMNLGPDPAGKSTTDMNIPRWKSRFIS